MISDIVSKLSVFQSASAAATSPMADVNPTDRLMNPRDTFTPSARLQGEGEVASNQMGWDQIESNTKRAHQLFEQKKYQEATDLSQRTIDGAESWKNFGSQDATDQTMTREALQKQIDLAGVQKASAQQLGHQDQAQQFNNTQQYFRQQLESL